MRKITRNTGTTRPMRMAVLKTMALAAGLALAGPALSQVPSTVVPPGPREPVAAPASQPSPQAASAPGGVSNIAPTTAGSPENAAPDSPLLSDNGAPPMAPVAGVGQPVDGHYGIQTQVTRTGERASRLHNHILVPVITVISFVVLLLLAYAVVRFRRSAHPIPSKTSHNTTIEVIWTLAPVLALVLIAIPSIGLLQAQFKPAPAGAVTLKAIGNQWYWTYQYPDHGGFEITANMLKEPGGTSPGERARTDADGPRLLATDNRVVLPVGVPIRLISTSNDVIHSWAMPAFWIKLDSVPGRLNETAFQIERPGLYFGQCSELCGARHAYMPIAVEAVPPAQFAAWVRAKGGTMPVPGRPSSAGIPQPGADVTDATSTEPAGSGVATENVTTVSPATSQGATGNPGGSGSNAGL